MASLPTIDLSPAEVPSGLNQVMNHEGGDKRRCREFYGEGNVLVRVYDNPNDEAAIITETTYTTYLRYKHRWYHAKMLEALIR